MSLLRKLSKSYSIRAEEQNSQWRSPTIQLLINKKLPALDSEFTTNIIFYYKNIHFFSSNFESPGNVASRFVLSLEIILSFRTKEFRREKIMTATTIFF